MIKLLFVELDMKEFSLCKDKHSFKSSYLKSIYLDAGKDYTEYNFEMTEEKVKDN